MNCNKCGLEEDCYCNCYVYDLEERIAHLEEELDKLTDIVFAMNEYIKEFHKN